MPYGLPKDKDTPENNAKMERCVEKVMAKGNAKDSAIAICKTSLGFTVSGSDGAQTGSSNAGY